MHKHRRTKGSSVEVRMHRLVLGKSLVVMAFIAWALIGQQVGAALQDSSAATLDLSSDVESPGYEITLRLSLRVPEGVAIGKAVSEITYSGKLLLFQEAMPGLSADAAGAEVTAVLQDAGEETSILEVTIAAQEGNSIPAGIIAEIRFMISEEAPADETKVPLKTKVSAWSDQVPPTSIEPITGKDGEVTISATPPVFACLFYMH